MDPKFQRVLFCWCPVRTTDSTPQRFLCSWGLRVHGLTIGLVDFSFTDHLLITYILPAHLDLRPDSMNLIGQKRSSDDRLICRDSQVVR